MKVSPKVKKENKKMSEKFENEMKLEFLSKSSNEAFARIAVIGYSKNRLSGK